jgi:hypothetical protein
MKYSITEKKLFNVIDIIMRQKFGDYTITIDENNVNEFFADHGFYSDREFPAFTVIDETLNVNSTGLIGFINDIIELTSLDILKFYFSKIFDRPINNIRSVMGQNFIGTSNWS